MSQMNAIREQAAEWLIHFDAEGPPDPTDNREFQDWLTRDPRHRHVFDQMQRLWTGAAPATSPSHLGRALGAAGLCLLVAVAGLQLPWQYWQADYRSAVGEVTTVELPDGSDITLNTNSAVDVNFDKGRRQISLIRGEVLLEVETDPDHPFIVTTRNGKAEAMGTLYSVRRNDDHSLVTVYESRVRVTTGNGRESLALNAGQWARMGDAMLQSGSASLRATPDWSREQLIFNGTALEDVVGRLEEYHSGKLMISDELAASDKRFTGALPTRDTEAAISLLAGSLGLDARGFPPYVVYLDVAH
ncbi:FecR family protein [Marinobacter sp. LN3S78]|uniref:FecR family protein n=1 Tax=Marinobacter sp. LN3S78 TaxID=3382300 RepID=UPI00387AEE7A